MRRSIEDYYAVLNEFEGSIRLFYFAEWSVLMYMLANTTNKETVEANAILMGFITATISSYILFIMGSRERKTKGKS